MFNEKKIKIIDWKKNRAVFFLEKNLKPGIDMKEIE